MTMTIGDSFKSTPPTPSFHQIYIINCINLLLLDSELNLMCKSYLYTYMIYFYSIALCIYGQISAKLLDCMFMGISLFFPEKHKSYHIKDEQLNRDGFKKFMKHETCQYPSCRFSRVCNHIHCIRDGCNYVLHSSGQLYSHKVSVFHWKDIRNLKEFF